MLIRACIVLELQINCKSIVCPLRPWNYVQILHFVKGSKVCILYSINIVPWQIPANEILLKCSTYFKSHRIVRHSIVLYCTGSHRSTSHPSTALSFITWHQIVLQCIVQHCIISYIIALHCIAVNHIGSHCITSVTDISNCKWTDLHPIRSDRIAYCIALQYCTALHCITSPEIKMHRISLHDCASHHIVMDCNASYRGTTSYYIASHHNTMHRMV